jgi:hypothetical protein
MILTIERLHGAITKRERRKNQLPQTTYTSLTLAVMVVVEYVSKKAKGEAILTIPLTMVMESQKFLEPVGGMKFRRLKKRVQRGN